MSRLTSKITQPDMVLLGNKVGGDIEMTGYGNIWGEKCICEKGCTAKRKETRKAKHVTVIEFTNLLGEPIFCIVII